MPARNAAAATRASKELVAVEQKPLTFRLPKIGSTDPHFGLTRSAYYLLEKQGLLRLIRIIQPGKARGITLAKYDEVRSLIEEKIASSRVAV